MPTKKILVIGHHKYSSLILSFTYMVLGFSKTGVDFDHYPDIRNHSDNLNTDHPNSHIYSGISCPGYNEITNNLKNRKYDLIITKLSSIDYDGGKFGSLSKILRRLKYSSVSRKHRLGGTIVTDWIKAGMELPPIIVVDDNDDLFIWPIDLDLLLNCSLYFKRELLHERFSSFRLFESRLDNEQKLALSNKMRPIWLSYDRHIIDDLTDIEEVSPYEKRDIDISHLSNLSNSYNRTKILPQLDTLEAKYNVVTTKNGRFGKTEYFNLLNRSRISVSLEGRGWDCFRHYETMLSGALLFVTRPSIQIAINLIDGENCVFIENDLSNFEELAEYYLGNPELSEKIAKNGYNLAKDHLGSEKLAEYVMNTIREHIR